MWLIFILIFIVTRTILLARVVIFFLGLNTLAVIRCYVSILKEICKHIRTMRMYTRGAWEVSFTLESECKLPSNCRPLGVCEEDQCVACPIPKGLFGWSESCAPPKLPCRGANVQYYKVEGVQHFMNKLGEENGPIKLID